LGEEVCWDMRASASGRRERSAMTTLQFFDKRSLANS
jgi:hypothetical protein